MRAFRNIAERATALASFGAAALYGKLAAGFWWLVEWIADKALGDAAFSWGRDMLKPALDKEWIGILFDWGPRLALIALGIYLFYRTGRQRSKINIDPRSGITNSSKVQEDLASAVNSKSIQTPALRPPQTTGESKIEVHLLADWRKLDILHHNARSAVVGVPSSLNGSIQMLAYGNAELTIIHNLMRPANIRSTANETMIFSHDRVYSKISVLENTNTYCKMILEHRGAGTFFILLS